MYVVFRADASLQIGTGHVMRCLTLADALAVLGAQCEFICREHPGHLIEHIRSKGYAVHSLPMASEEADADLAHSAWLGATQAQDAQACVSILNKLQPDWLVIDHYALDRRWEQSMRPLAKNIMVIDDLADRSHDCDLLLDQNLGRESEDYNTLVPGNTTVLIGPTHALLRPEFARWREYSLARRTKPQLKKLLITMGGVDKENATGQVLAALEGCALLSDLHITVVMGPHAPRLAQVQAQAAAMSWPTQVLVGVRHMAQLMAESDLCIGAAGGTAWERCTLGLPTLLLVVADNQMNGALALQTVGAASIVQNTIQLGQIVTEYCTSPTREESLMAMSHAAAGLSKGTGASSVALNMLNCHV